jgi:hypothetical protein
LQDFSKPKQTIREKARIIDIIKSLLIWSKEGILTKHITSTSRQQSRYKEFDDKSQVSRYF